MLIAEQRNFVKKIFAYCWKEEVGKQTTWKCPVRSTEIQQSSSLDSQMEAPSGRTASNTVEIWHGFYFRLPPPCVCVCVCVPLIFISFFFSFFFRFFFFLTHSARYKES